MPPKHALLILGGDTLKLFRFSIRASIALGLLCNAAGFGAAPRVSAQTEAACTVAQINALIQQRKSEEPAEREATKNVLFIKLQLSDMNTDDPKLVNEYFVQARSTLRLTGGLSPKENASLIDLAKDNYNFWLERKRELDAAGTKGLIENNAGQLWKSKLRAELTKNEQEQQRAASRIDELDKQIARCQGTTYEKKSCATSIVGTWKWWNGLTVTFVPGGRAFYRGSASGGGSWQKTGGSSYHAHWNAGNTNDYFTLSRDGTKIEGQFDGKPGTSTRTC